MGKHLLKASQTRGGAQGRIGARDRRRHGGWVKILFSCSSHNYLDFWELLLHPIALKEMSYKKDITIHLRSCQLARP